jgi:uncharacterized coiled-coil protein SlyX
MNNSTEERMARLEVMVADQRDDIREMKLQMAELVKSAHMGRGALWLMLPMGTFLGWMITHVVDWLHK